jgi:predicted O-methyltransferase YrrM
MDSPVAYRTDYGWRAHSVFGALGLRPAVAQHSEAEAALLQRLARDQREIVEIGVAEGGSAWDMRSTMSPQGRLTLIDPYPRVAGINLTSFTARRLVDRAPNGKVEWRTAFSHDVVGTWGAPIDLLLIDGDHSYAATREDFEDWSPHVAPAGKIIFHDALLDAPWMTTDFGSHKFVTELQETDGEWKLTDNADSMAVFTRA